MRTINIHEAKTHLSRLVDEAEQGESFIIAKAGKPKVKVIRLDTPEATAKRRLGGLEGMYKIPDDFDEIDKQLDKEIEELMLGKDKELNFSLTRLWLFGLFSSKSDFQCRRALFLKTAKTGSFSAP